MTAAYRMADDSAAFVVALNAGEEPGSLIVPLHDRDGATLQPELPVGWPWPAGDPVAVRRRDARPSPCPRARRACSAVR